jgi:hypothetical protein
MIKILITYSSNVFSIGASNVISLATLDTETGIVNPNSTITYESVQGADLIKVYNIGINKYRIAAVSSGGVISKAYYYNSLTGETIIEYLSVYITNALKFPTYPDYINLINSEMPQEVFTNSPVSMSERNASAMMCENLTNDAENVLIDAFPEFSNNDKWISELWSLTQTLSITRGAPNINTEYYQQLFQFLRNTIINCSLNPFDLAYNTSKFIYLLTGTQYYVYADETFDEANETYWVYVIDPNIAQESWILGQSILGTTTIIGAKSIFQNIIYSISEYVNRIGRFGVDIKVDFTHNFVSLNLDTMVDNTYKGDFRLGKQYCIMYNTSNFTNATGYIGEFAPNKLVSIAIVSPDTSEPLVIQASSYQVSVIGTYLGGYSQDVTSGCSLVSSNPSIISVSDTKINAVSTGSASITAKGYGLTSPSITYSTANSTTEWVLDYSKLDTQTILG